MAGVARGPDRRLIIAIAVWRLARRSLALDAVADGAVFALWPVMWIVFNALLLYNIAVASGRFDAFRAWMIDHLPNDRRIVLVVIGFCFGALLEGVAGFGTPVAITSSLLILVGFPALEALTFTLIFNTAPVAFGALGVPVTVLGAVTGLPAATLGAMVGRQLPFIALLLPFYVMALYGGVRSLRGALAGAAGGRRHLRAHPVRRVELHQLHADRRALVAGLADRDARLPAGVEAGARSGIRRAGGRRPCSARIGRRAVAGLAALVIVSVVVIVWTTLKIFRSAQKAIPWPGLDKAVSITLYKQALRGGLGLPAARDGHRDPARGDHHGARGDGRRRLFPLRRRDVKQTGSPS